MTERKDSLQADLPSKEAEPANYPAAGQPINNLQPITMTQPSQPSQQQQPPGLVAANRTPGIHPALAALNPSFRPLMGQQAPLSVTHPPPAGVTSGVGQSAQRPLGLHPSFFLPGLAQQLAGVVPIRPKIQPKVQTRPGGASSSSNKKQCNCKNSRCLKLYCECFASGKYCDGCNCKDCCNNKAHEDVRQAAVEAVLDRNPNAFRPKIAGQVEDTAAVAAPKHNKGCNCKKSGCLKKYCECFQAGITCSDNCRCVDCKNFEGSASRAVVLSQHPKSKAYSYPPLPRIPPTSALATTKLEDVPATGMTQSQRQLAAKEVLRDVMQPEVVEKLASLLMVVSAEEAERHPFIGPGPSETSVSAGAPRSKLYEEQERLVLTEFRDALRTITRVVADKVEKKASVIAAKQNAIAAALAAQQAQAQAQAQARPAQVQVRNTQLQIPHGMQAVYALRNGQPQMVLVPQALLAQHQQMQQNLPRSLTPQQLQVAGISQQPAGAPTLSGVPAQPQLGQSAPTPELDQTKAQQPSQVIN